MKRALLSVGLVLLAGCGGSSSGGSTHAAKPSSITVFAASSLTKAFTAEGAAYTKASGQHVTFSFAGSQALVAQIQQGAPANVLATADTSTMGMVASKLIDSAQTFAKNRLVIVTAPGNPKHIETLADLAGKGIVVVLAAPAVPAGKYAAAALTAAKVTVHPKSLEDNVEGVLTKVELGEADAGIVYVTDAEAAGTKVDAVAIADGPIASYPIGALDKSGVAFVDFVLSKPGQAILAGDGFLPPA